MNIKKKPERINNKKGETTIYGSKILYRPSGLVRRDFGRIVLMGVLALSSLPVEQYPDIAPPTIQVFTNYPGANAETVQKAVVVPLEEAINGVENMNYITSSASNTGDVMINVYFKQGCDADMAAVNVQNRVSTH